jgi:hypothetical protein
MSLPRRVRWAVLIGFLCHGFFILSARYRLSYDAYTHMLFADHYARGWFALWEPRWYAGFTVVSYPPLAHQLTALLIPLLGFDAAYAGVLWLVVSLYPLAVYAFSRAFVGRSASSNAALAAALLLPIYITAYIFGQFPFLTATLIALFGAAALGRYLRQGGALNLALAVSLAATSMAAHHATLLLQPFLALAVLGASISKQAVRSPILRGIAYGLLSAVACWIVIWPFWQWGLGQVMQTPIDHLSRHNFLTDPQAQTMFFWPLYGPLAVVIPFAFWKWGWRVAGLQFSFFALLLLGLGGTTGLPRLLFGQGWQWLTYDRFSFWASLTLLPFFGGLLILFKRRWKQRSRSSGIPQAHRGRLLTGAVYAVFAVTALASWFAPLLVPLQPPAINMGPILDFLNQDHRSQWRYLTFGFGNQYTYLNLLTTATTIDGSYHTARSLPFLRSSGIAEIDMVMWSDKGLGALGPILQASDAYGVRWGFVARKEYVPELEKAGWLYCWTLSNGIDVWENPDAVLPASSGQPAAQPLAAFSWGTLPMLALVSTLVLAGLQLRSAQVQALSS